MDIKLLVFVFLWKSVCAENVSSNVCGSLEANSYYDGQTAVGEITFHFNPSLHAAFHYPKPGKEYTSISWWKSEATHPILFKISKEKMVIITDTRYHERDNTLIIRGMNQSDASNYHVDCTYGDFTGRTKSILLTMPDKIIIDPANQRPHLSTATVALIIALSALFVGQFVVIAIICFRRRNKSRQVPISSQPPSPRHEAESRDESRGLLNRYAGLPSRIDQSEETNLYTRRDTSVSIDSNYDKIPFDIGGKGDFKSKQRKASNAISELGSIDEHGYMELREVVDYHVTKTVHYVNTPARKDYGRNDHEHSGKSDPWNHMKRGSNDKGKRDTGYIDMGKGKRPQYENLPGDKHRKMTPGRKGKSPEASKNRPKFTKYKQNSHQDDYLDMDSFERGADSDNFMRIFEEDTHEKLLPAEDTGMSDGYAVAVPHKQPFRIQNQDVIKKARGHPDIGMGENRPNHTDVDDEEDPYLDMESVHGYPITLEHDDHNERASTSRKWHQNTKPQLTPNNVNKGKDPIDDDDDEDPYICMEQASGALCDLMDVDRNDKDETGSLQENSSKPTDTAGVNQDSETGRYTSDEGAVMLRKKKDSLRREPAIDDDIDWTPINETGNQIDEDEEDPYVNADEIQSKTV